MYYIRNYRRWKTENRKNNIVLADNARTNYYRCKKDLRRAINKSKRRSWQELIAMINDDPWGSPYKIVLNKIKGGAPPLTEIFKKEILNDILSKLFPRAVQKNVMAKKKNNT